MNVAQLAAQAREMGAKVLSQVGRPGGAAAVASRAGRMSSHDLIGWAETCLVAAGRSFGDWQREGRRDGLDECRVALASLQIVMEELNDRLLSRRL